MMVDGYRKDANNHFGRDALRTNPAQKDPNRPRSSALVDLNDPIQVHLLTETALFDSRQFVILSQEEVDDLKKQCQTITQRIETTRANLAVQIKYRDAAANMAKLFSPTRSSPGRRTPFGSQTGNRDSAEQAELERQVSERKCEELASELWGLEKRIMEPQRRLLEHTAAILQLTHKGSSKKQQQPSLLPINGMPGSPESLYTYSNGRSSVDLEFQRSMEIPPKSPIREQTTKLRGEADRLKQENDQLRAQTDAYSLEMDALRQESSDNERDIMDLEQKLESLNSSLRDVIVKFNPAKNSDFRMPPSSRDSPRGARPAAIIGDQLDYLASTISAVKQEQEQGHSRSRSVDDEASAAVAIAQAEGRLDAVNRQITDLLLSVNAKPPPPPNPAQLQGGDLELDDRISYLQYSLRVVETELIQAVEAAGNLQPVPSGGNSEPLLRELWDIIQDGFSELRRQREDRKKVRQEKGLDDDEDEMAIDESFDANEPFSATGLSIRIRSLSSQISKLTEHKVVLKRQIKQQRELNNKSSGEKDIELQNRDEEIERRILEARNKEDELQAKIAIIADKDSELLDLDKKVFDLESKIADLDAELNEARSLSANSVASAGDVEAKDRRIKELEAEMADMQQILEKSRADATQTQGMLLSALRDLDTANRNAETMESENLKAARAELEEKTARLTALDSSSKDLESRLNMTEASRSELQTRMDEIDGKIESLEVELAEATAARKAAELSSEFKQKELDGKQREIKEKDDVLDSLNMMVVELKTELTIAQAELEGAYGSRAERAADVAALKSSDEVRQLNGQIDTLKGELEQTLKQLEDITRETINAEREKLEIEGKLDDAVAARSSLEAEIQDLRDRLDAEVLASREKINKLQEELDAQRLKVVGTGEGGSVRAGAGASMLSEQFRATMREERKKFQEDMRVRTFLFWSLVLVSMFGTNEFYRKSKLGGGSSRMSLRVYARH